MKKVIDNEFTSMKYKRTVYETSKEDKAKVLTNFAPEHLPGAGFSVLMIGGTLQDGEKEVLELRFHTKFLPHLKLLVEGLEDLARDEEGRKKEMIEAAESIVNGDSRPDPSPADEGGDVPAEEEDEADGDGETEIPR